MEKAISENKSKLGTIVITCGIMQTPNFCLNPQISRMNADVHNLNLRMLSGFNPPCSRPSRQIRG